MLEIYVDFDGTITNRDSIVALTERFGAGNDFRDDVLRRVESGEIDVFECIRLELGTVTCSWERALSFLEAEVQVDPTFAGFVQWSRANHYPVAVVSSGIEQVVRHFLRRFPELPIFAHTVDFLPDGWVYRRDPSKDKTALLREGSAGRRVFIGDGISDIAAVPYSDFLFAKRRLAKYCRENNVPHYAFEDFEQIRERLEEITQALPLRG